ncbi:uncharacterized protein [Ptychodera flava]|uniref:uncharacterized protein n=1 Tax=Ptychodera flava TaxID=63121 RepID=UPI003969C555
MFAIKRCADALMCPVTTVEAYFDLSMAIGVNLITGYLFRPTNAQGTVEQKPVSSQLVYHRLKTYLQETGIDSGETPHGCRTACAISLSMAGSDIQSLMSHVGWRAEDTALYYMQLAKVTKVGGTSR